MIDQEKEQQFKDKIKELESALDRANKERVKIQGDLYDVQRKLTSCERENDILLNIVKNLSESLAK